MKATQNELLNELARVTSELGAPPSRRQWKDHAKWSAEQVCRVFGSYSQFLQAAGVSHEEAVRERRAKIKELFTPDVDEFLSAQNREAEVHRLGFSIGDVGLALPDTHFPWADVKLLKQFIERVRREKPRWVIQLGDLYDMFSSSKFPKTHMTLNPAQEIKLGFKMADEFWRDVKSASPKSERIQILGNHDARPLKRILEAAPELEVFLDVERFFKFDGVTVFQETRDVVLLNDRLEATHGHWAQPGAYARAVGRNVIHGHTHKLSTTTVRDLKGTLHIEASCGFAGAYSSKVQEYHPKKEMQAHHGFMRVQDLEFTAIPANP